MSVVILKSDLCSVAVIAVLMVIDWTALQRHSTVLTKIHHCSPVRAGYSVSFVVSKFSYTLMA